MANKIISRLDHKFRTYSDLIDVLVTLYRWRKITERRALARALEETEKRRIHDRHRETGGHPLRFDKQTPFLLRTYARLVKASVPMDLCKEFSYVLVNARRLLVTMKPEMETDRGLSLVRLESSMSKKSAGEESAGGTPMRRRVEISKDSGSVEYLSACDALRLHIQTAECATELLESLSEAVLYRVTNLETALVLLILFATQGVPNTLQVLEEGQYQDDHLDVHDNLALSYDLVVKLPMSVLEGQLLVIEPLSFYGRFTEWLTLEELIHTAFLTFDADAPACRLLLHGVLYGLSFRCGRWRDFLESQSLYGFELPPIDRRVLEAAEATTPRLHVTDLMKDSFELVDLSSVSPYEIFGRPRNFGKNTMLQKVQQILQINLRAIQRATHLVDFLSSPISVGLLTRLKILAAAVFCGKEYALSLIKTGINIPLNFTAAPLSWRLAPPDLRIAIIRRVFGMCNLRLRYKISQASRATRSLLFELESVAREEVVVMTRGTLPYETWASILRCSAKHKDFDLSARQERLIQFCSISTTWHHFGTCVFNHGYAQYCRYFTQLRKSGWAPVSNEERWRERLLTFFNAGMPVFAGVSSTFTSKFVPSSASKTMALWDVLTSPLPCTSLMKSIVSMPILGTNPPLLFLSACLQAWRYSPNTCHDLSVITPINFPHCLRNTAVDFTKSEERSLVASSPFREIVESVTGVPVIMWADDCGGCSVQLPSVSASGRILHSAKSLLRDTDLTSDCRDHFGGAGAEMPVSGSFFVSSFMCDEILCLVLPHGA
eukprot:Gregarina_sp_Poly_1__7280@NODE_3_length_27868_cov_154_961188_g2_i0_p4_GENE_NODE_3_length_27868_cov_154_961188_g2_i0NODE_3_length_27868_cov_154_961188_g2_i0_p4_ORF_typecomplete_len777_score96_73_NODE_3_length_27868_cov_154_961188_g2_i01890421234